MPGRKHGELRAQKQLPGLPSLAFLDAEGQVLVKVPFDQFTIEGLDASSRRAQRYVDLRADVAAGKADPAAPLLLLRLEEGQLELPAAQAERERIGVIANKELQTAIDTRLVDLRIATALRAAGQAERHRLGPEFFAMLRDGPKPSAHASRGFHYAMLEWAELQGDAAAFRMALDDLTRVLTITDAGKAWVEPLLQRYQKTLTRLEGTRDR
ncbi:MAG: hypothetical protein IPK26_16455 [Planctomycetes bacterium]|nr:hypothetical protein [Planctomycetota bacterium]